MTTLREIIRQKKANNMDLTEVRKFVMIAVESMVRARMAEIEPDIENAVEAEVKNKVDFMVRKGLKGDKGEKGKDGYSIKGDKGEKGDTPIAGVDFRLPRDGRDGVDGKNGKDGKDGSPDTPNKIAEKLNTTEESVNITVIRGLSKEIERLKKNIRDSKKNTKRGGGSGLGDLQYTYDLSDQCNGSNKVFTVPAHKRVILLIATDFPRVYRPTVDFTTSGTTLTLTSEVEAPLSGATLLFSYVEL